jgi:hypothetical protein
VKLLKHLYLLLLISCSSAYSQNWTFYRHEFHAGIGASSFLGELGGANQVGTNFLRDLEFSMTRPNIRAGYAFMINPYLKLNANVLYGRLRGDDALTQEKFRNNRNLHFRSPLVELSVSMEYYPFQEKFLHLYSMKGAKGSKSNYWSPYLSAGFGGMWFNPKAQYTDGKWYALQPLGTEGQGLPGAPKKYNRVQIFVPVGLGIKYSLNRQWSMGFEISRRFVFTDYLDDVSGVYYDKAAIQEKSGDVAMYFADPSLDPNFGPGDGLLTTGTGQQRGDATDNDSYMFAIFSVHYRLMKGRFVLPKF